MDNDLISRKAVIDYLKTQREKLITGMKNKDDKIPRESRIGALLTIKAMACFITQFKDDDTVKE